MSHITVVALDRRHTPLAVCLTSAITRRPTTRRRLASLTGEELANCISATAPVRSAKADFDTGHTDCHPRGRRNQPGNDIAREVNAQI